MERKLSMVVLGVVAILIVVAVGAALVLGGGGGSSNSTTGVKILTLQKNSTAAAYSPLDKDSVYNGSYPLSRYLYLYTDGVPDPSSSVYKWINMTLSSTGQQLVSQAGFYGLQPSDLTAMKAQLVGGNSYANVNGNFKESGSTTMAEIAALWAQEFKNETGNNVQISTPGSGPGIADFAAEKVQVAQASRPMTSAEKTTATDNGINVTEWKVAVDGLSIIVNKANPVNSLTLEQLEGIYNGTYTNWKQVGGNDQAIVLYGRDSASGSYASFKDLVLKQKENYSTSMQQFNSNALIVPEVENNAGGIGYVGIGYAKEAGGTSASAQMVSYILAQAE